MRLASAAGADVGERHALLARRDVLALVVADAGQNIAHGAAIPSAAVLVTRMRASSFCRARPKSSASAASSMPCAISLALPATTSARGGVEAHDVAIGADGAIEQVTQGLGVLRRIAALQFVGGGARQAELLRR